MAKPSDKSSIADNRAAFADYQPLNSGNLFKDRLALAMAEKAWKNKDLSTASGVPEKRVSDYLRSAKIPSAEYLFPMADALSVSAEWLALGKVSRPSSIAAMDIDEVDIEMVPFFDFREITDTGKGEPIYWQPFRKDWLGQRLGTSFDLYLVQLRSDYHSRLGDKDLHEGDLVFCRECEPSDLEDGYVVIWRREHGLKVARYSLRPRERVEEDVITPSEVSDDQFVPVARILGKFLQRV